MGATGTMASAILLLAVLLPTIPATSPGVEPVELPELPFWHKGADQVAYLGWNVTDAHIEIAVVHPSGEAWGSSPPVDVVLMLGPQGADEPSEWYVLHLGERTIAAAHDGQAVNATAGPDRSHTMPRSAGAAGDCMMAALEVWRIVDHQREVVERIPAGSDVVTWGNGTGCHTNEPFVASEATAGKGSAAPAALLAFAALLAVVRLRR